MKTKLTFLWAAAAMCSCLDLELLDEMQSLDAGVVETGGEVATTTDDDPNEETGDGSEEGGGNGPPAADPGDTEPPSIAPPDCAASERTADQICIAEGPVSASLRFATSEPASISVTVSDTARVGVLSDPWSTSHHVVVADLVKDNETAVTIEMEDATGNLASIEAPVSGQEGQPIAITEVLADPFGPEPSQEFVEIANLGTEAVDLSGWMIDDCGDANGDLIPEGTSLEPGRVAVLVSPEYDPVEGQDPSPPSAAPIITLSTSIGSNGLKNSDAESIELYDAAGILVSQYQGQAGSPVEGSGVTRITAELPDGDPLAFELDPSKTSTPGSTPTLQ
ncbi:MAG: lamin tail domain-containing protein [Deltaproteobacteria bacterium]|nr:lamin tail domain-containing protein [Deltaproteobacteria bacterium]